jgi:FMN phosphatase YigB (HAD superfamily)
VTNGTRQTGPLVLFDLDDTLIDRTGVFSRWAHAWAERHGFGPDAAAWLVEFDDNCDRPRKELFEAARRRFDLRPPVWTLVDEFLNDFPTQFEPDPVVLAGLTELRRTGWRIALATNGSTMQRPKMAAAGLLDCVDGVCVSEEIGMAKPDPGIFRAAATAAGGMLANGWMVGDSPQSDITGGAGVGLRTIWVSRGRDWPLDDIEPTVTVSTGHAALAYLLTNSTAG